MKLSRAIKSDRLALNDLRVALWSDAAPDDLPDDALSNPSTRIAYFMARDDDNTAIGFAEVALRSDYVNGCNSSPVLFLEGVYVDPAHRRQGVASALLAMAAQWGLRQGCCEFASDALIDNIASHHFHAATGFVETERVVYFRKPLMDADR